MGRLRSVPGAAPSLLRDGGSPLLRPDEQVFAAMLDGWRDQQLARALSERTIEPRLATVRRFQRFTNEYPWIWTPRDVEEFTAELRGGDRSVALSTVRAHQGAIRLFCDYIADPRYEWTATCERLFGDHPAQVCFEWNTAVHTSDYEGRPQRRALTKTELQGLFDHVDDQVVRLRQVGNKGWLACLRDATAFKIAYAYGLRRRELAMLDMEDFAPNPHAPEFGSYGVIYVRWGKATKGSPPRRRSTLTVFPWTVPVVEEWVSSYRGLFDTAARFAGYRAAVGLPEEIGLHCLRHSYVTHLIEDGYDPLFVQQQVGHSYASTTALYTSVSSDYRTRTLRRALDSSITKALAAGEQEAD